ncbi:MAG: FG-GAP-like repeat-containing protein [Rhodothermales bacterium]|nr:FG-GAP-like repeat-containing protein [Rhodothermales bacterium]MDG2016231.1 FG-GAP-like repeat-containing protein [Rhodothermales bacterium]
MVASRLRYWLLAGALFTNPSFAQIQFEDVTHSAGMWIAGAATGVAFVDADGDGWEDITLAYANASTWVFANNADGTFSPRATVQAGGLQATPLWVDLDNDGIRELIVGGKITGTDGLFRWHQGFLEDRSSFWHFPTDLEIASMAAADYDGDGFTDLFLALHHAPDLLLRNSGGTHFEDRTAEAGIADSPGSTAMQSTWIDVDGDGDQDLFSVYDGQEPNRFFVNQGDGTFLERAAVLGLDGIRTGNAMGIAWGDFSEDGRPDAYVSRMDEASLFTSSESGVFADEADATGLTFNGMAWGTLVSDFDNDLDLDIAVANVYGFSQTPNLLYVQQRPGIFSEIGALSGFGTRTASMGLAAADFDHDGRMDVIVPDQNRGPVLLRNTTLNSNQWLRVQLTRTANEQSIVGSRVAAYTDGKAQFRWIQAGDSFDSQSSMVAHFGLGSNSAADSLLIHWSDGGLQHIGQQPSNRTLIINRNGSISVGTDLQTAIEDPQPSPYPNPSHTFVRLQTDQSMGPKVSVYVIDMLGRMIEPPYSVRNQTIQLDVSALNSGTYFAHIRGSSGNYSYTFTVLH